ncbi:hypothetical protein [Planococcus maritimus]|uniref:hypothetical protein n=1 Tax=Planococcus maritimus TaxID=192421 RepID=UPI0012EBD554|nr:hypothetical protein [Planococcus maritimus]
MYQETFHLNRIIDIKTLLQVVGTLGGAFLGAYFAGKSTLTAMNKQIEYDRSKNLEAKEEKLKKSSAILNRHLLSLVSHLEHLRFLVKEKERGLNIHELDFNQEINDAIQNVSAEKASLASINTDMLTIPINEDVQEILYSIVIIISDVDTINKDIDPEAHSNRIRDIERNTQRILELKTRIQYRVGNDE